MIRLSNRLNHLLLQTVVVIVIVVPTFITVSSFSAVTTTAFSLSTCLQKSALEMASSASPSSSSTQKDTSRLGIDYPELVVFDADACLWDQEMYEMPAIPTSTDIVMGDLNGLGQGVIATKSGPHVIKLYPGSLLALQQHALGQEYPGMRICIASSADTPFAEQICRANLKLLQVLPASATDSSNKTGMSIWDLLMRDWNGIDVNQIGRQPPLLSSNKAKSHFPNLRKATGIRYDKMLFFDDCNWGDHCGMVARECREEADTNKGPATYRTPNGLGITEWHDGLAAYRKHTAEIQASSSSSK